MNASPTNLNPVQAVQAAPQAGKDAASPDVPFSQVLSGEIAQTRKSDAPRESGDASAKPDPASQATRPADGKTDPARPAKADKETPHDRRAGARQADAVVAPETLLALPVSPDAFLPAAATRGAELAAEPGSAPGASAVPATDASKGRTIPAMQAGQRAGDLHATQKPAPGLPGKEDVQGAGDSARPAAPANSPPAEPVPAFADPLAAARKADAAKMGEFLSDLVSNPALQTAPHAPLAGKAAIDASSPRLAPAVGTTAWGQALGEKLVWMAAGTQQTASLTLNPPNLGPLQIVLNITNDQATASFFSAQPEVRHALEAAFPRLRDMMNDAGIQLGQATVSADTPQQQNDAPGRQAQRILPAFPGADPAAPTGLQAVHAPVRQSGRGLVDTFA